KNVDPGALVVGPEEWGWSGYFFSGFDQQYGSQHGWSFLPDRANHGNMDYLPWLLQQLKTRSDLDQRHVIDAFTVHYYPQGGEFGNDTSSAMQLRRNRSTRSLWDPNYVDETWINDKVKLIPRLRGWVSTYYYAGTPVGITEYNWGAEGHINGATTQADIYGIFGRESLDFATRWTTPDTASPTYNAMKMYRNYDGNRSTFGETSVSASSTSNADSLSVFAAQRSSDQALTVMVISKVLSGSTPVTVNVANFSAGSSAQVWQLTSSNAITRLSDVTLSGQSFTMSLPAQSITLFVVPATGAPPNQPPVARATATPGSGTVPLSVAFDGSTSSDADGSIVSYSWTFGDGANATGATASHAYTIAGNYSAVLKVTDNQGAIGTVTVPVTVNPGATPPAAPSDLTASVGSNRLLTLNWTDNSSNETGFYVERALKAKTLLFSRIATVGTNVKTYSQTETSGQWVYRVQAYNAVGTSGYSNSVTIRVR
ncbi:MAG TPA: PKD domain-containing protein, partial [Vicinamibacterales bacterium]